MTSRHLISGPDKMKVAFLFTDVEFGTAYRSMLVESSEALRFDGISCCWMNSNPFI